MVFMVNVSSPSTHFTPVPVKRAGCPCKITSFKQESLPTEDRTELIQQYTAMKLVHLTKQGATKNLLDLGVVHHELKLDALTLDRSGASNILVCTLSFDCLIIKPEGEVRDYLTFELKIPGVSTQTAFSSDTAIRLYGGKENLYAALQYFYSKGRDSTNSTHLKHGHNPTYDPNSSKHDQYILHTEQMIAAYLATHDAAVMLTNRLRAEIRGKYSNASFVKVYNMGLHMHSTKTCCAPCEYVLLGLMNQRGGLIQNGQLRGFIANFIGQCLLEDERLTFKFPQKSQFRVLVTVTAGETDAHHKQPPSYIKGKPPTTPISVKDPSVSHHIFTTLFTEKYDERRKPEASALSYKTIAISGSYSTKGSPGTINKVKSVKAREDKKLEDLLAKLSFED